MEDIENVRIGRLTRDGVLVAYLAVDTQLWFLKQRHGIRRRRTLPENRVRYRMDLLTTWDEGFLTPEDEDALARGCFKFKGETLTYQELTGAEKMEVFMRRFSKWE